MGLPSLTLEPKIALIWRRTLEQNGLSVKHDETEGEKLAGEVGLKRVSEVSWQVSNGVVDLRVLEVAYLDRHDPNSYLVLFSGRTNAERQLLSSIQEILVAAGATVGVKR